MGLLVPLVTQAGPTAGAAGDGQSGWVSAGQFLDNPGLPAHRVWITEMLSTSGIPFFVLH